MNPISWYRGLERKKQLVAQAVASITLFMAFSNVLYITYPNWTWTPLEWNGVAFGMITSIAACYYALYGLWHFYGTVDTAKEEVYDRLGVPFVRQLVDIGRGVDERFARLRPEERARIMDMVRHVADAGFYKVKEMATKPRPKRKRVRRIR